VVDLEFAHKTADNDFSGWIPNHRQSVFVLAKRWHIRSTSGGIVKLGFRTVGLHFRNFALECSFGLRFTLLRGQRWFVGMAIVHRVGVRIRVEL